MKATPMHASAFLAVVALAGGCATSGNSPAAGAAGALEETRLQVSSHHWDDVRVYALGHGARVRLGTVSSMEVQTFVLPPEVISADGSVQLVASPIASARPHQTDLILLRRGDRLEWHLENPLSLSSYAVYAGRRK